jgi:predicted house-cleaning NTP pyrophosphatase (Maf/HAM1 superfamily)
MTMDQQQLAKAKEEMRLTQLEIDSKIIKSDITVIKNNHLAHMAQDIDRIENKLDKLDNRVWAILFSIVILAASNVIATFFN